MEPSEYRKQYTEELKRHAESRPSIQEFFDKSKPVAQRLAALQGSSKPLTDDELAQTIGIIRDPAEEPELRASALRAIGPDMGNRDDSLNLLLGLLRDRAQPGAVRMAALQVLQTLAIISPLFMSKRPDYFATLRSNVDDPDTVLRQAVIEILALEKDEYVQRRLLEGLDDASKALVSPEKAVQLLGHDVHAELYPRLREIVQNPSNPQVREEAVRLLAGDPDSKELLVNLMRNKDEDPKIRTLSAVALQTLDPAAFADQAKQIVIDDTEHDQLRVTGLTGLTHFADRASLRGDPTFDERLKEIRDTSASPQLRSAADKHLHSL